MQIFTRKRAVNVFETSQIYSIGIYKTYIKYNIENENLHTM